MLKKLLQLFKEWLIRRHTKLGENTQQEFSRLVSLSLPEELHEFLTPEFLEAAAGGFLAGEIGPKQYERGSWKDLNMHSTLDILPSFLGHISHSEKDMQDPDTGLYPEYFVAARAIMYVTRKVQERKGKE